MDANRVRTTFIQFFADRGHTVVPSDTLIPRHPMAPLFTNAGMNQFFPYFLGEEPPPFPRATDVQRSVRIQGKHDDIDNIGRTWGHLTFFEMLGSWSFGDYFKQGAIELAWELSTEHFHLDGDRIWITVHHSDDEAFEIWHDGIGVPADRIQRLGDDNWWGAGDTGPCGPCSELNYDMGAEYGEPGGPALSYNRYREYWNLVFMQYDQLADGTLADLPRKNIDTGAGLERIASILQNKWSVYDTDELRRIVGAAEQVTGRRYGDEDETDVALRVMGDHARTVTFLVNDGVFPSNEDRGYVLRRLMRRTVRFAYALGVERPVLPAMVESVVDVMGEPYPEIVRNRDFIVDVVTKEEERFRQTLKAGTAMLEEELARGERTLTGAAAFRLHDTFGFPIELTREIAAERGVDVDFQGFHAAMEEQRRRAREARKAGDEDGANAGGYRELIEQFGATEFTGYQEYESKGRVLAVLPAGDNRVEIFLDRTPFYAEAGGQVGDTGTISTDTGTARVLDTTHAVPGLHRHVAEIVDGEISAGQEALASIEAERRESIRRNHTGTHLLHWALREVLGGHVKQQGSLVAPDRLRFDFSHHGPVSPDEMAAIEDLANARVLANEPVRAYETSKTHAEQLGAIAFFGDKYGDYVRIVEAGTRSMELCGGTHVGALGMIGPIKVISEGSIGSNMRRIEALTGEGALKRFRDEERLIERTAEMLRATPEELPDAVARLVERQRELDQQLKTLRSQAARGEASSLAAGAVDGVVVARKDELAQDQLRELAVAIRDQPGIKGVVLIGSPDGQRVALVGAFEKDTPWAAPAVIGAAAKVVGGGGGGKDPTLAVAGGKDVSKIDDALDQVRGSLGLG